VTSPDPADPPARSVHLPTSAARWLSVVTSGEHDEQISTEHLLLVPLRASDAEELAGLLEDPLVRDWLGADDVSGLRDRFSGWESRLSSDATELWLNWIVRVGAGRRAAAWVQATVHDETATVAYCVLQSERRARVATASLRATVDWLHARLGLVSFTADIDGANRASQRVAQSAGFTPTERRAGEEIVWSLDLQP
jgi:RimJ/RimL family protein N-acetyltransferase